MAADVHAGLSSFMRLIGLDESELQPAPGAAPKPSGFSPKTTVSVHLTQSQAEATREESSWLARRLPRGRKLLSASNVVRTAAVPDAKPPAPPRRAALSPRRARFLLLRRRACTPASLSA